MHLKLVEWTLKYVTVTVRGSSYNNSKMYKDNNFKGLKVIRGLMVVNNINWYQLEEKSFTVLAVVQDVDCVGEYVAIASYMAAS